MLKILSALLNTRQIHRPTHMASLKTKPKASPSRPNFEARRARRLFSATKLSTLGLFAACWAMAGTADLALGQESAPPPAVAASSTSGANAGAGEVIRCKSQSGQEVREIRIKSLEAGKKVPCEVVYKKADGEKVIYSAQAQEGYCEMKATEFSEKLTGLGFDCGM